MKDYFSEKETACRCGCGLNWTDDFRNMMNMIRHECGFPLPCSSGARCETYDKLQGGKGVHPQQTAGDFQVSGYKAFRFMQVAFKYNITGVGVKQHGKDHSKRFVHIDCTEGATRPWVWSYPK